MRDVSVWPHVDIHPDTWTERRESCVCVCVFVCARVSFDLYICIYIYISICVCLCVCSTVLQTYIHHA